MIIFGGVALTTAVALSAFGMAELATVAGLIAVAFFAMAHLRGPA